MAVKETGIKRTEDGGIFCEKCNADLSKPKSTRFCFHLDGRKSFKNGFECVNCGAVLTREYERSAEDAAWWA